MKKKTKKKPKSKGIPLGCLRIQVSEEPISPPMEGGPLDLRAELESVLNSARQTLAHFGGQPALVILYAVCKKVFVILDIRGEKDKIIARTTVKVLAAEHQARAAIFTAESWIRPSGSISREDPRREEALVADAKSSRQHFMAVQKFHRLNDGQFFFENPKMVDLQKGASGYDSWLDHIQF
jgi:hypothetical protein